MNGIKKGELGISYPKVAFDQWSLFMGPARLVPGMLYYFPTLELTAPQDGRYKLDARVKTTRLLKKWRLEPHIREMWLGGLGSIAIAKVVGVPKRVVEQWLIDWRMFPSERSLCP